MTTRIGYFIPEFPGQTHMFFWREMQALRESGVMPEVVSTRLPDRAIMSHTWAEEARKETEYLYPPSFGSILGACWTMLRAGPAGWWRTLAALASADGSIFTKLGLIPLVFAGAQLASLAARKGWRHVHVHSCANAATVAVFANRLRKLSYSLTLHGPLRDYGPHQKLKWAHSAFAIVITRKLMGEAREQLAGALPPRLELAPMGVDLQRFETASAYRPWTGDGPVRLFSCGRLNPSKGHDDVVKAVARVRDQGLDVRLHIAGEDDTGGGMRRLLEQLKTELRLTEAVVLLGAVSEDVVRKELSEAHAFVLGSLEEPLGVAIMEAMAMRVPVVVTGAGGVPELVDDGKDGLLVPAREPGRMAESLLRLLRDPGLASRLSESGRRKIETSFHSGVSAAVLRRCMDGAQG
jgi:colanic acid/amylovoran biosynthesis glycosyltransferase